MTRIFLLAIGAVALAGAAGAQSQPLRLPEGTTARPVVRATIRSEPAPQPVSEYRSHRVPAYPVAVTYVPVIVMSDGSVFANFGQGYQLVRNACRASRGRVIDGRGMAGSGRYTQPAPAQRSASAEALPHVQEQRRREAQALAHQACYTRTSQGIVVVR